MKLPVRSCQWQDILLLLTHDHRHCVRTAKEIDSNSIGLCPQGFESPRCRFARTATAQSSVMSCRSSRVQPTLSHRPHYALARPSTMPVAIMMNPLQNKVKTAKTTIQVLACLKPCNGLHKCYRLLKRGRAPSNLV